MESDCCTVWCYCGDWGFLDELCWVRCILLWVGGRFLALFRGMGFFSFFPLVGWLAGDVCFGAHPELPYAFCPWRKGRDGV